MMGSASISLRAQRARPRHRLLGLAVSAIATLCAGLPTHAQSTFLNFESAHVSPLALSPDGQTLLAVNTADNRLEAFDISGTNADRPRWVRSISVGFDPVTVRVRPGVGAAGEAWVVNTISDSISIIDLATWRVSRTILTGDEPMDVVFANDRAFVSVGALNQVRVHDLANLAAAPTTITIAGFDPRMLAVSPDGSRVYAAIFFSGNGTTTIPHQLVSDPTGPYGGQNPPPNSGNAFSPLVAQPFPAAMKLAQIVKKDLAGRWRDDNARDWTNLVTWGVLDNDIAIIDSQSLAVSYAGGMLSSVFAVGVRPDGLVTAVGLDADNLKRFEPNLNGTFARVEIGSFSPTSPTATSVSDLNPHLAYTAPTIAQPLRELSIGDPRAILWHPAGTHAYVSGLGSSTIISTNAIGTRLGQLDVGQGPTGLALSSTAHRLYVLNRFDSTISTIDTATFTEIGSSTTRPRFFDPTPSAIKLGRPFLYDTHTFSGLGHLSCASCHIDGKTDHLAWDLGVPGGPIKQVNFPCINNQFCQPWHPVKGPMVTQTLQGIIGQEPLHWRGDKENLAAFDGAYTDLQGAPAKPSASQMASFQNFVATIKFLPNPNRQINDLSPSTLPVRGAGGSSGGIGSPGSGQVLFNSFNLLGQLKCVTCHPGPTGTSRIIDDALLAVEPQSMKMAGLRGLYKRIGFDRTRLDNIKGVGFAHDGEHDTLFATTKHSDFIFAPGITGDQQRMDLEAFMLCFPGDVHAGIGQQLILDGTNNTDPAVTNRLNTFISLGNGGAVGLIAKTRINSRERGYFFVGGTTWQSDRRSETTTTALLTASAASGREIVLTIVPSGMQTRLGVDRDLDTFYDFDEISGCSNPADPTIFPGSRGSVDADANLLLGVNDIFEFLNRWFANDPRANFNNTGGITVADVFDFLNAWFTGC